MRTEVAVCPWKFDESWEHLETENVKDDSPNIHKHERLFSENRLSVNKMREDDILSLNKENEAENGPQ